MITLYGFGRIFPLVIGETRDLRVQWALEEIGLPYEVHALDHTGGEHKGDAYSRISPFNLVPVVEDNGFAIAESGAILLYLAEKGDKLLPRDPEERMQVIQWCFSVLNTVERPLLEILIIDKFGVGGEAADSRREHMVQEAARWLGVLERRLQGRNWLVAKEFSIADILLTTVLRNIRRTDLLRSYPRVADYFEGALSRPAWERTIESYANRLGVDVADIH